MIVEKKSFHSKDGLQLRCGKSLPELTVGYECYGELNEKKSNAILLCHALTGDAHAAGKYHEDDPKPGWWDTMIGPGKAFDTNQYYVVCSNILGSCYGTTGPSSINPETGQAYKLDFPMITISDMVNAQHELMKDLQIDKWLLVTGGSLGGMQALQWSVAYPDKVHACLPVATTASLSPQAIAFDWVGREAIRSDKDFNDGDYQEKLPESGVSVARMLAHITYLSEESMNQKFGRELQESKDYNFEFNYDFKVESYLNYQGAQFVNRFDANSYLYITRAMDYFHLAEEGEGSLDKAMDKTSCRFMIISFSSDWLFPPSQSMTVVKALQANKREVSYCEVQSDYGHDAFLLEVDSLGDLVRHFLHYQKKSFVR